MIGRQPHPPFTPRKENRGDRVDEHIDIDCPSSVVLRSLEQYFRIHGHILELIFPDKDGADPEALALISTINVDVEAHPSRTFLGRYDDRLDIRWYSASDLRLSFAGRFTIRPLGSATELTLKGRYDPPFLALEAMFHSVFDDSAAHAIARALLERLTSLLETEFGNYRRVKRQSP
jgi:hypothetical protein